MSVSRRDFLKKSALVGAGVAAMPLLAACGATPTATPVPVPPTATKAPVVAPTATKTAAFDWKRFKGEKIEVTFTQGSLVDVILKNQKEFEELTGITVGAEQVPEQQARQKQVMEFNAGATSFDVCHYSYHVHKKLFAKNKWTEDLRTYLADPTMTAPDFDWKDFSPGAVTYATDTEGRICSIPIKIDFWMLYWNKDLFAAKGIAYPKTFDEMLAAAQKLNDPSKNIAGFLARGIKNANVPVWTHLLQGWDVDPIDPKGNFFTESPEAIEAAKLYQNLLKNYSAAGVSGFNWNECQSAFLLGQAAMWQDGIGFATPLEDADQVQDRRQGRLRRHARRSQGQALGHVRRRHRRLDLQQEEGAGLLLLPVGHQQTESVARAAGGRRRHAAHLGAHQPGPGKGLNHAGRVLRTASEGSGKMLRAGLPEINTVTEFRDIFGIALTNMIGGADPATELKKATADYKPIYDKNEK